jgi:programmed cell death protein 4
MSRLPYCPTHPGASTSYADAKERIGTLLSEYLSSHDAAEATRCLRALGLPFFHHELVKQGVYAGMANAGAVGPVIELLKG